MIEQLKNNINKQQGSANNSPMSRSMVLLFDEDENFKNNNKKLITKTQLSLAPNFKDFFVSGGHQQEIKQGNQQGRKNNGIKIAFFAFQLFYQNIFFK